MGEFESINLKKLRPVTRVFALIFSIGFLVLGVYLPSIYTLLIGVVLLLATLFDKKIVVNQDGVLVTYHMRVAKYSELWTFDQITQLYREQVPNKKYCALHFTKDVMSKRLIFTAQDAAQIIDLALSKNSQIHFDEAY